MMNVEGFSHEQRDDVRTEYALTLTKIEAIMMDSPYMKFYRYQPGYIDHLGMLGEVGIVANQENKKYAQKWRIVVRPMCLWVMHKNIAGMCIIC